MSKCEGGRPPITIKGILKRVKKGVLFELLDSIYFI